MNEEREMTIDEWCAKLPESHAVNQQLRVLTNCRNHPFKWAVWDALRKTAPFIRWRSPAA